MTDPGVGSGALLGIFGFQAEDQPKELLLNRSKITVPLRDSFGTETNILFEDLCGSDHLAKLATELGL